MWRLIFPVLFVLIGFLSCASDGPKKTKKRSKAKSSATAKSVRTVDGSKIFKKYCITCHGFNGKLEMNGAKDFSKSTMVLEDRIKLISNGKGLMTPFKEMLSKEEIEAVAKHTMKFSE